MKTGDEDTVDNCYILISVTLKTTQIMSQEAQRKGTRDKMFRLERGRGKGHTNVLLKYQKMLFYRGD